MGLLESLRNRGGLLGTVGQTLTDYQQLANAYPNASKFAEGLIKNLSAVAPPDPRNQQQSMQYSINRAFDVPGGFGGAIDVWHGSPHKFDAFDMSKIGTGEGAQAYGHGLYFAENPDVAKNYQDWLGKSELLLNGKRLLNPDWNAYGSSNPWILDEMENIIPEKFTEKAKLSTGRESKKLLPNLAEHFNLMKDKGVFEEEGIWSKNPLEQEFFDWVKSQNPEYHKGSIYKTSLQWPDAAREAADPLGPQHFLDWDKPLHSQSNLIKDRLPSKIEVARQEFLADIDNPNKAEKLARLRQIQDALAGDRLMTGADVYHSIASANKSMADKSTEYLLNDLGIPGIRYLDGGSRSAGDGSYNYVVFDDKIPRILERNGIGLLNSLKR